MPETKRQKPEPKPEPEQSPVTKAADTAARKAREAQFLVEMDERFASAAREAEGAATLAAALPLRDPILSPDELAKLEGMRDRAAQAEPPLDES
jgi:hypothetical protein